MAPSMTYDAHHSFDGCGSQIGRQVGTQLASTHMPSSQTWSVPQLPQEPPQPSGPQTLLPHVGTHADAQGSTVTCVCTR